MCKHVLYNPGGSQKVQYSLGGVCGGGQGVHLRRDVHNEAKQL